MFLVIAWHRVHGAKAPDALVPFPAQCILQLCCANSFLGAGEGQGGGGGGGNRCRFCLLQSLWHLLLMASPMGGGGVCSEFSSSGTDMTWVPFPAAKVWVKAARFCDVICIMLSVSSFTTFLNHDWSVGCGAAHSAWGYIPLYHTVESAWSYLSCTMGTAPVGNTSTNCILDSWR